jgi:hypothetical protein
MMEVFKLLVVVVAIIRMPVMEDTAEVEMVEAAVVGVDES